MSAVPSAFTCVLLEVDDVLVMPEGVVMVLDLLIVPALLVVVDDFDMPAGFCMVLDFVVTFVPGWVVLVVVVFDELLIVAAGAWAWETVLPSRLRERRKPKMRFIIRM
ncbi:hypothetical protein GCM10027345_32130 [Hymenobacter daeguensis]